MLVYAGGVVAAGGACSAAGAASAARSIERRDCGGKVNAAAGTGRGEGSGDPDLGVGATGAGASGAGEGEGRERRIHEPDGSLERDEAEAIVGSSLLRSGRARIEADAKLALSEGCDWASGLTNTDE